MPDYKNRCAELAQHLDDTLDFTISSETRKYLKALISTVRSELAEPESQRRCLYSPVQIAECGGPCEQGPEHCDCGELCVTEPESEEPTDEEIMDLMPQQMRDDFAAAARVMSSFHPDIDKTDSVFRMILNRHSVDHARAVLTRWGK